MKVGEKSKKKGFTIIEVSLVLAIAGLIFLMVFVALPGLRTSQRDTERRNAIMAFVERVKKYQTNNRGTLPGSAETGSDNVEVAWSDSLKNSTGNEATWGGFYRDYLGENFMDPDGVNYKLQVMKCGGSADVTCVGYGNTLTKLDDTFFPNDYKMLVVLQATCNGNKPVGSSNPRNLAVLYRLEGSEFYCDNT